MANKKEKKDTVKHTLRTKKIPMLKLDNNDKIAAKIVYTKDNSKCFRINDIDINKIRISEKVFTVNNIMHTNIMCSMSIIMNTCR